MHKLTQKTLFALLVSTCLGSVPLFAANVNNLITKTIDLKVEVEQGPLVCQNNAYLVVRANQNNSLKLMKIDLSSFAKDTFLKAQPTELPLFADLKNGFGNNIID